MRKGDRQRIPHRRPDRDRGKGVVAARVLGMLLGLAVFGATFTTDPDWAIFWLSIALSGLAAAVAWSIPSLIAPRGGTATIGGIMNLLSNMFGVVAPITTGYIVGATHSFTGAFLLAASWRVFGILA
jgi:ACS family D-galactonate transporter-like MFS transporter